MAAAPATAARGMAVAMGATLALEGAPPPVAEAMRDEAAEARLLRAPLAEEAAEAATDEASLANEEAALESDEAMAEASLAALPVRAL